MQCESCQHVIDPTKEGELPESCPECGAPLMTEADHLGGNAPVAVAPVTAAPVKAAPTATEPKTAKAKAKSPGGLRGALNRMVAVLLFVGAVTVAVASTMVAMKVIEERDQLQESVAVTNKAFNDTVLAMASNPKVSSAIKSEGPAQVFAPAIQGYQAIIQTSRQDPERLGEAADAYFRMAALQAKCSQGACVGSLAEGFELFRQMGEANYDAERFPSLYDTTLHMTVPLDWGIMKDTSSELHAGAMLVTFTKAIGYLQQLSRQYPQSLTFRSDLAGLLKVSATLQALIPPRAAFALDAWLEARDTLETLVRDQPTNVDFQTRLVEALNGAANMQKRNGETDKAIANFTRAVEVRQQLADANPDNKELATELDKAKKNLEKMQPAGASASAS